METKLTRDEAICTLLGNDIFTEEDIKNHEKASEFYIKHLMEGWDICDIDRMAHLNTLFGYDIGVDNWQKFDSELWGNELYWDDYGCGVEIMELTYKDKPFLKRVALDIDADVSFDKWKMEDFKCYEYY